jgi:hypothetical protein
VQKRAPVFPPYNPDTVQDKLKAEVLQGSLLKENAALKKALAELRSKL